MSTDHSPIFFSFSKPQKHQMETAYGSSKILYATILITLSPSFKTYSENNHKGKYN